jgi:hypothetical protein
MNIPNNPATGKPFASLQDYVLHLEAEKTRLEAAIQERNNRTVSFKVAEESGAVSAYGLNNRMPVTLYSQQWPRLIEAATGKPLASDAPLAIFLAKADKYLAGKDDTDEQKKNKAILRKAELTGIVSHPSDKNKKEMPTVTVTAPR